MYVSSDFYSITQFREPLHRAFPVGIKLFPLFAWHPGHKCPGDKAFAGYFIRILPHTKPPDRPDIPLLKQ